MTTSVADNADHGLNAEEAACERWPLERVSGNGDEPDWFDARFTEDCEAGLAGIVAEAGTPVEVKVCRLRYPDRFGRWWIKRANHERLLKADGEYVLAVHEKGDVLRQGILSAQTVDALIEGWWAAGDGGQDADQFVQLPWSAVLDSVGGEQA